MWQAVVFTFQSKKQPNPEQDLLNSESDCLCLIASDWADVDEASATFKAKFKGRLSWTSQAQWKPSEVQG